MTVRVCALVEAGSAPGRNPLLAPLGERLARAGVELVRWDPTGVLALPPPVPPADLYLVKGDHPSVLSAAGSLADAGAACVNRYQATALVADKARTHALLATAGLPVPRSVLVGSRPALAEVLADGVRFVKPVRGAHGVGAGRRGPGDAAAAGPGPWLVQEAVEGRQGEDLKVYGVGERVAVRSVRFSPGAVDAPRMPADGYDPAVEQVACQAAALCGLVCFGADFLVGQDGPVLVDLNAFPGYRGVEAAAGWVADAVLRELGRRP